MTRILASIPKHFTQSFSVQFSDGFLLAHSIWLHTNIIILSRGGALNFQRHADVVKDIAVMHVNQKKGSIEYGIFLEAVVGAGIPPLSQEISKLLPSTSIDFSNDNISTAHNFSVVDIAATNARINDGTFVLDLMYLNRFYLTNGLKPVKYQLRSVEKVVPINVVSSNVEPGLATVYYTNEDGITNSYSWALFLCFNAVLIAQPNQVFAIVADDYTGTNNMLFSSVTYDNELVLMQNKIWSWMYNGNLLTTSRADISVVNISGPIYSGLNNTPPVVEIGHSPNNRSPKERNSKVRKQKQNQDEGSTNFSFRDVERKLAETQDLVLELVKKFNKFSQNVITAPILEPVFSPVM